jgi:ABC-type uncharacterized transport system ATPase component
MKMGNDLIEIDDLRVTYSQYEQSVRALDGVCLRVEAGEAVIITGRNGSGKSTLLEVLSRRILGKSSWRLSGRVLLGGNPIEDLSLDLLPEAVFHVHQDPLAGTVATMTVFENLILVDDEIRLKPLRRADLASKYRDLLAPLGLANRLDQQATTLSPGQRQALTILIAGLRRAKVILLDEPLAALDATNADLCLALIRELKSLGKTLLYVTHHVGQTESFGDRIVTLSEGRIISDTANYHGQEAQQPPVR